MIQDTMTNTDEHGDNPLDEYFISPANEEKLNQVIAIWEASLDRRGRMVP